MNIRLLNFIEGAKQATGLTVVIDVFRAFSVEAYIMARGAGKLIAVGDMQIAYDFKEKDSSVVLIGERKGVMLPGFDFGNSPTEIANTDFNGRTVVHTTSAGTQGIANSVHADEVITASLVNAKAVAKYIKYKNPETVSIVAMGVLGTDLTPEDTLCQDYIKSMLEGKPLQNLEERIKDILNHRAGKKFFDPDMQHVYPKTDFALCTDYDKFDFVLKVNRGEGGLNFIERIDCSSFE